MKTKMLMSILLSFLVTSLVAAEIPANEKAKEKAKAPENSPVIDGDWELTRLPHYVQSDVPDLKAFLGVRHEFHEFPGLFSTDLTPEQVEFLDRVGIDTVPVQLYQVTAKAVCGDGIAHKSEQCGEPGLPGCPAGYVCENCKCVEETAPPDERSCYPRVRRPWNIQRVNGGSGGTGVTVAVLDTGVYKDHLDLKANVGYCKDATKRGIRDGCTDSVGHGTHVSGTILANGGDDEQGILGVAPEATLMAIKVCGNRGCWGDDIAEAIYYAADNGANIISMSLGGDSPDLLVGAAIDYAVDAGVLLVASAGNDGPEEGSIDYPAAHAEVIAVGAIGAFCSVPDWSSRGTNPGEQAYFVEEKEVEFAAPGVSVESTYNDGCYTYKDGTSMAAPHVSGLAAILWQGSAAATRSYLQSTAVDFSPDGDDPATGFGLPIAAAPGLTVLNPNGGESWHRGGSYAIEWISIGGSGTVDIYLLKAGSLHSQLADDIITYEGVFLWDIPMDLPVDSDYRIQIDDGINTDKSDADFSIVEPSSTFDIAYDRANASMWFGGDDRDGPGGRNVGVGQSFQFNENALLQTFGFRFTHPFDYFQNPEGAGHAVDLILHIRSEDGNIIAERETHVPATFSGGWVLFD
ncbi:MAG: S8 family serine peptidase, partial [Planctomycetota bacterium]